MKKYFLMFVAAFALVACGGGANKESNDSSADKSADEMTEELTEMVKSNDAEGIVKLQNEAASEIKALYAKGDTAAAEAYKYKIIKFLKENKSKLDEMKVTDLIDNAASVPAAMESTAKEGTEALKSDASQVKDEVKTKAEADVQKAKADAKEKANAAIDQETQKAQQKANDAVEKAKADAKKKLGLE